jgi:arabinose-5-phosphate isomerase
MSPPIAQPLTISPLAVQRSLARAREILLSESAAITKTAESLNDCFATAVTALLECRGSVVVTGIGKAGLIGQKISASFSSTGTPSHFLHPAEAVHGDLGTVCADDIVLLLSYSGETEEITRLLPSLRRQASCLLAITSSSTSQLALGVDVALLLGKIQEACPHGLAPSSTTTAMLALGDALALVTSEQRGFSRVDFARFHPGGALGRSLTPVEQVMRPLGVCRVANQSDTLRQVLVRASRPGRRTGAVMLTDAAGKLTGVFTDSDLAKLLERSEEYQLDQPVEHCMTKSVQTIQQGEMLPAALRILSERKISELPVIDTRGSPLGIIDITDLMSMVAGNRGPHDHRQDSLRDSEYAPPVILPMFPNSSTAN